MATHQQDQLNVANPTDQPFTVKWAGNPYTLLAGQRMVWPRFLAEHFAKHLTDSILLKREEKEREDYKKSGRPMSEYIAPALLNNRKVRPSVVDTIILGVYTYYTPQGNGAADQIQQQINNWNPAQQAEQDKKERVTNIGDAVDPLLGALEDEDDDDEEDENSPLPTPAPTPNATLTPAGAIQNALDGPGAVIMPTAQPIPPMLLQQSVAPVKPAESGLQKRARLMKEAKQLGIKTNPNMTVDTLEQEIKKLYA